MNHDRRSLESWARASGYRTDSIEKVVRLGELLSEVSRHPFLGERLVLKGGTALNLAQARPPRLSVDLDFNYVGSADRAAMLAERPEVERDLSRLTRVLGYQTHQSPDSHAGRKVFLEYRNVLGGADRIEVDLNYLFRVPLRAVREGALWQPGDLSPVIARMSHLHEIAAGKLCALLARSAPRDLFDAARLPGLLGADWSGEPFRALFVGLAGVLEHPLHSYGRGQLERATPERVAVQLTPMLPSVAVVTAESLISGAWPVVEPLTRLSEPEREFVDRMQDGDIRTELLFPDDPEMQQRLAGHPALLWKAQNAREHRERHGRGST